jgi:hypothetical protein
VVATVDAVETIRTDTDPTRPLATTAVPTGSTPPEPPSAGTDGVTVPERVSRGWKARARPLLRPSGYYVLSRVGIFFVALASKWLFPRLHPLAALGTGWDGHWYTFIAQHGYPHGLFDEGFGSRWAFFPAFPATIKALVATTGLSYGTAGMVLGLLFGLTAAIAIWLAVREVFGPVVADRSVLLFVFFPAAYVLSMAYTEGLFLTAAAGCLFALSRRYWITASLLATLASLTRSFGVVMIACIAIAAIPVILKERRFRPLVALALSPLGFIGWLAYSWSQTGTPLAFIHAEKFWGNQHFVWFAAPFQALFHLFTGAHGFLSAPAVTATAALVFMAVGILLLARSSDTGVSIPTFWWVFTIGSVFATMSPFLTTSILRYSMAVFPLFAAYAWRIRPKWEGSVIGVLALSQGALGLILFVGVLHPHGSPLLP